MKWSLQCNTHNLYNFTYGTVYEVSETEYVGSGIHCKNIFYVIDDNGERVGLDTNWIKERITGYQPFIPNCEVIG